MAAPAPAVKPRRLDDLGDRLRVVTVAMSDLYPHRNPNVLTADYPDLWVDTISPRKSNSDTPAVRVGSAAHFGDTTGWHIDGRNAVFAEVEVRERPLSPPESLWCDLTFMFRGDKKPETVVEFTIPTPDRLRDALSDGDVDRYDCLTATILDAETRHRAVTEWQSRYEETNVLATKLHRHKGNPVDLDPEWDPENDHNDDRDQRGLYNMASMRTDAHLSDFRTFAGFSYTVFRQARSRVLDIHEPKLEPRDIPALDVAGAEHLTYCRLCGAVDDPVNLLQIDRRGTTDWRLRVCESCSNRDMFTEEAVDEARDRRAQERGGQRTLSGEYEEAGGDVA